ncbi:MAG TPA: hypothetical protein DHW39_03710 [Erysipelotrichaceae bacterium]|nr:hypothetical protein [Erysipelotrichaceae bacterium]
MTSRSSTIIKRTAAAVLIIAAVLLALYWYGFFMPSYIQWHEREYVMDLDGDGTEETLTLKNRKITLSENGTVLCEKPQWLVSDVLCADIDHDGITEVVMLAWVHGDYGESHPFWERNQYLIFSEHFYIFEVRDHTLYPQWMSSKLIPEIVTWKLNDDMSFTFTDPDGEESIWAWLSWGMERIDQEYEPY